MKRCPITYQQIAADQSYSQAGLHLLSPKLHHLKCLNLTAEEQRQAAITNVGKLSIQGMQKKLSAQLKVTEERFAIVDQYGHYILKPQASDYPELPQNEALTMSLAKIVGIDVPVHGMVYSADNSFTYFIKRFDRGSRNKKIAVEDFSQLLGFDRETKYDGSMEKVISVIEQYCSFPKIELAKLFKLTLFNFLIGNEDMHLKNFSLITKDEKVMLSPAFDLLNSTIAGADKEELALPLRGKRRSLSKNDFLDYFAREQLNLNEKVVANILQEIQDAIPLWRVLIEISFLSDVMKEKYLTLLRERCNRLGLISV